MPRPSVESFVNAQIENVIESGQTDLADHIVRPTLQDTLLRLIGIPLDRDDQVKLSCWSAMLQQRRLSDPDGALQAGSDAVQYLLGVVRQRRSSPGPDDMMEAIMSSDFGDGLLSDEEIAHTMLLKFIGGLDTTANTVLESILFLANHPAEREQLLAGALDWEPLLRSSSGTSLQGQVPGAQHVSFGAGAHLCIGRHIARMEIEVILRAVFARLGDLAPLRGFVPEYWYGNGRGMLHLPMSFSPDPAG